MYSVNILQFCVLMVLTVAVRAEVYHDKDYPYALHTHARCLLENGKRVNSVCNGFILNKRVFLSSAYCYSHLVNKCKDYNITAYVGGESLFGGTAYHVDEVAVHPGYDPNGYKNDIALVRVNKNIKFRCAVSNGTYVRSPSYCDVGEFLGRFNDDAKNFLVERYRILSKEECQDRAGKIQIHDGLLCAGSLKKKAEHKSVLGGTVLVTRDHILVGVTAYQSLTDLNDYPIQLLTNVSTYYDWIKVTASRLVPLQSKLLGF